MPFNNFFAESIKVEFAISVPAVVYAIPLAGQHVLVICYTPYSTLVVLYWQNDYEEQNYDRYIRVWEFGEDKDVWWMVMEELIDEFVPLEKYYVGEILEAT